MNHQCSSSAEVTAADSRRFEPAESKEAGREGRGHEREEKREKK